MRIRRPWHAHGWRRFAHPPPRAHAGAGVSGCRRVALAQVLSRSQIGYLRDVVGLWPLPPGIRALGPLQVRTYRTRGKPYDVDISRLPAGEEYVEIARKVPMADANQATRTLEAELSSAGIAMCADQSAQAVNKLRSLLQQRR